MPRCALSLLLLLPLSACDSRPVLLPDSGSSPDGIVKPQLDGGGLPDAAPGGCSQSSQCKPQEFCKIDGACAVSGAKLGTCTGFPVPCADPPVDAPVCGCDGKTYGNTCFAWSAGVNVSYSGKCGQKCGLLMIYPACPADKVCDLRSCGAAEGTCVEKPTACGPGEPAAYCGCDGKTYPSECARLLAGVALDHEGACAQGGLVLTSDKALYTWGQTPKGTLANGTPASVFLAGCGAYAVERKEAAAWVDKGTTVDCAWEGYAKEVKPGSSYTENVYVSPGGTYRLRADYGLGCAPNQPLSSAKCASFGKVFSAPFVLQPDVKECMTLISNYDAALSKARVCDPAINTPQCLLKATASLGCGCDTYVQSDAALKPIVQSWNDLGCATSGLPGCPPMPCPNVKGAGCVSGVCMDIGF